MITNSRDPEIDHWGRYKVSDGNGGFGYRTRASTMASTISDRFRIEKFQKRQVAVGLAMRGDLMSMVIPFRDDAKKLDEIVAEADQVSASGASANIGTSKHKITADIQLGRYGVEDVSAIMRDEIRAILDLEKRTAQEILGVEFSIVNDLLFAAGTADRLYRLYDGRVVIGDLKTGRWAVEYAACEIAVQLSVYANGEIWDPGSQRRQPWADGFDPTTGVIIHAPSGTEPKACTVDLETGWLGASLAYYVRDYRKQEVMAEYDVPAF